MGVAMITRTASTPGGDRTEQLGLSSCYRDVRPGSPRPGRRLLLREVEISRACSPRAGLLKSRSQEWRTPACLLQHNGPADRGSGQYNQVDCDGCPYAHPPDLNLT
jgi:hypothetical protein